MRSLVRVKAREEMEGRDNFDPTTGSLRFRPFFYALAELAKKKKGFSLVSVKLPDFQRLRRTVSGVETADDILRKVYQSIELCVGKGALVARDAGGHFHVALRGAASPVDEGVVQPQTPILRNISSETTGGKRGLEIGAAHFPKDSGRLWELLDAAEGRGKETNSLTRRRGCRAMGLLRNMGAFLTWFVDELPQWISAPPTRSST